MPPKFRVEFEHRTRGDIDRIIDRVTNCDVVGWWLFEYDEQVVEKPREDITNIYFQIGLTMGAKGKIFLCAETDEQAVALRMKVGV